MCLWLYFPDNQCTEFVKVLELKLKVCISVTASQYHLLNP